VLTCVNLQLLAEYIANLNQTPNKHLTSYRASNKMSGRVLNSSRFPENIIIANLNKLNDYNNVLHCWAI